MKKFKIIPRHKLCYSAPYIIVFASRREDIDFSVSRLSDFEDWRFDVVQLSH